MKVESLCGTGGVDPGMTAAYTLWRGWYICLEVQSTCLVSENNGNQVGKARGTG